MFADLRFQCSQLLAGEVFHERQHCRHGIAAQHSPRRGQGRRLCNGNAGVQGQDGPGVVAPQLSHCPANAVRALALLRLQVGQQVVHVVHRVPSPVFLQHAALQLLDAVLCLHIRIQDAVCVPDGGRKARVGRCVPQRTLHHAAALFQQDGQAALHALLQKAASFDGGVHLHALDLAGQLGLVHRDGVVVLHRRPLESHQLHAVLVDEVRGVVPEEALHVLDPLPVVVGQGILHGVQDGVGHGHSVGPRQHSDLHGLPLLVGPLDVTLVVERCVRQSQAAVEQVLPAVRVLQVHVQAAQLPMGQRHGMALRVLQPDVHQLRAGASEPLHLLEVGLARHVVEELGAFHDDLGLPELALVQHVGQLFHLAVFGVPAQHPEDSLRAQHIKVVLGRKVAQPSGLVALRRQHFHPGLLGKGVDLLGFGKAQGLVFSPDHMQRPRRDGFQHPQLLHGHGQIGAVLRLPDAGLQPVPQPLGLFAVAQRLGLGQLLVQPVQLRLLGVHHISLQGLDELRYAGLFPVVGKAAGVAGRALRLADGVGQRCQLPHRRIVQNGHIRQLRHLCRLLDEPRLHILALRRPQDHLVQLGGIVPDAPLQFVGFPSVPRPLHPLFGQCFCHGNVLVPLLAGHFHRNGIFLGLFLLPRFGFLLVLGFPLHDLALLHDLAVLRPVSPALLVGHLPGEVPVLRFQSFVFQRDLVQHLLPLFLQALFLGSPFPFVGFLQHIQLLGHVAGVGDVHAQCIQIGVQHRFCLGIPALLLLHLLHCFALVPGFLVLRQTSVEFSRLLLLHSPQVFHSLGRTGFVSGCCGRRPALPLLERVEDGLCVVHLVHVQQIADHPARQLHLGIFVLSHIREPAHHPGLDGVVHVHQHIQPLGALHAGRAVHARSLGGSPEQFRCALLCAAHAPGIVHNGLVFFRRVSVPVSFLLPQLHAVPPGLGHRFAPASVLAHKLRLGFAVLVHGVAQLVVFRVLLPQLGIPIGSAVEDLPGNGLGQSLRLVHVGPFGLHILDQGAHLAGHTLGVRLSLCAAGLH